MTETLPEARWPQTCESLDDRFLDLRCAWTDSCGNRCRRLVGRLVAPELSGDVRMPLVSRWLRNCDLFALGDRSAEPEESSAERDRAEREPCPAEEKPGEHIGQPMHSKKHTGRGDR